MLDYLKTREAAVYTRMSVPTLERKRLVGDGPPFVKAGKSVIYRRTDLDAWLASRLVHSTSEGNYTFNYAGWYGRGFGTGRR